MNSEVPFNLDLNHRLLTIISHLILLLASWLMFWRLCPAVSFSVAGFSRYSSVFSLYPVVTGFSRYSSVFSLHPVGSLWLLVLLCCHLTRVCLSGSISCGHMLWWRGGWSPHPCFIWTPFLAHEERFYETYSKGGGRDSTETFATLKSPAFFWSVE